MSIGDILKNLSLDNWYKVLIWLGVAFILLSILVTSKSIRNIDLLLLGIALLLIGLGEWKNEKTLTWIKPPNAYTGPAAWITQNHRSPDSIGIVLDWAGVIMLAVFLLRIVFFNA